MGIHRAEPGFWKASGLLAVPALQLLEEQRATQLCKPGVREREQQGMSLHLIKCFAAPSDVQNQESWGWGLTDAGPALIPNSKLSSQRMALKKGDSGKNLIKASNELHGRQLVCMANSSWAGSE